MEKANPRPVRFELRLSKEQGAAIDEWRRRQPDLPNRNEAVRRLIDLGLEADNRKKGAQ